MKSLPQRYIHEVKTLLPYVRKKEKIYLQKMSDMMDDYCLEQNVSTMEELYQVFGRPQNTVSEYYSSMDSEDVLQLLQIRTLQKRLLCILSVCIIAFLLFTGGIMFYSIRVFEKGIAVKEQTIITIYERN